MKRTLEQRLAAIHQLDVTAAGAEGELREALRSTTGALVAVAARRVGDEMLMGLAAELAPAFARLIEQPVKRDPWCRGKVAIVKALHALDRWEDDVLAAGVKHVQPEGMVGEDTAGELRGLCGLMFAQSGRADALDVLAGLLADPERTTREAAARGVGDAGRVDGTALLRYKLLLGDEPEPEVLAACAESLLALARERSAEFLIGLLDAHDARSEAAALALGGARVTRAFEPLRAWCLGAKPEQRNRVGYLAMALLRSDEANAYLLEVVSSHAVAGALAAARALATFKDDRALAERLRAAAKGQRERGFAREVEALLS